MTLSLRTTRHDLNAGDLMVKLVAGQGCAGGRIEPASDSPVDFRRLEESLTQRLLEELGVSPCAPRMLIGR